RFHKIQEFKTEYAPTTITQYESVRSGMQVIVADREGPKINGYFTLATEILDDSGAPHTLEHLVFMGSRSYQYKGLLDKLASRAYSSTNAWTAVDHTAYTLETAGWEGFAQILPVYLEHVILPTITDEACTTEVHHIDGEGNDAGVVYSEMQALRFNMAELMDLRARRILYPENVGFRYETGGMPEQLRDLTPQRIREFHKAMYQPRNLAVVIVGETDHENLLDILDKFEESIEDSIPPLDAPFKRQATAGPGDPVVDCSLLPWIDSAQPPPLKETVVVTEEFPEEDESTGDIACAFFGPNCNDLIAVAALNVLLTYLCGSSVSVLENIMVEKEELASSVSYWWDARPNSTIWFQPTGVAAEKLEFVEKRLHDLLKDVASKPLDMSYMKECISRERRQVKFSAESSEQFYSQNIISDYLFGKRDGSTLSDLKTVREYDVLNQWADEQWRGFLKTWLVDVHHVSVLGKPSMAMATKLKEAEEARIAKRKEELGEDGLRKLAEKLEAAKAKNEVDIPPSVLDQWPVPGTDSIHFIESATARSGKAKSVGVSKGTAQKLIDNAKPGLPLFVQYEHVPSNFVNVALHIGTSIVPVELKPLMSIFIDNFFNTPIKRDGKLVDFEDVVMELEKDTISYAINGGGKVYDPESIFISLQLEPEKYTAIIEWVRALMFDSVFDVRRLKASMSKALADIPEAKRDGRSMSLEVDWALHVEKSWLPMARRTLVKAVYLRRLKKLLQKEPEKIVEMFEQLRKCLFTFENVRVLVTSDIAKLSDPVQPWDSLTRLLGSEKDMAPIIETHTVLNSEGKSPGKIGSVIIPMTSLDSSYSVSTTQGLKSYNDSRVPAMLVAIGYLEAVEGPLWNAVRGSGLAYGTHFSRELDWGFLQYRVYRSPDASKALDISRETVEKIATGQVPLDRHLVEGAVSGIVSGFADEQSTMADAAQQNYILSVVRGLGLDWTKKIMAQVRNVTDSEIRQVMKDMIMPVFQPGKSNVVVTCAPIMQENMEKAFKTMGYATQVKALSDFHEDYGLAGGDDDNEDPEEDEDEEDDSEEEDEDDDDDMSE
ncbi:hypothetical protein M406DRAFT_235927, partial [Cryphonectria parasitica EP155]